METRQSPLPDIKTFCEIPGPRGKAHSVKTAQESFDLFIDSEIFDELVKSANIVIKKRRSQLEERYQQDARYHKAVITK